MRSITIVLSTAITHKNEFLYVKSYAVSHSHLIHCGRGRYSRDIFNSVNLSLAYKEKNMNVNEIFNLIESKANYLYSYVLATEIEKTLNSRTS
jgi:hypothetical protein